MTYRSCVIAAVILQFCFSAKAPAQSTDEAWKKLNQAMTHEMEEASKAEGPQTEEQTMMARSRRTIAAQLRAVMDRPDNPSGLDSALTQAVTTYESKEVARAIENLRNALREAREARDAAIFKRANDLTKRAAEVVRTAKEPRDLDSILNDLAQFTRDESTSEGTRTSSTGLQRIREFMVRWQDYLAAVAARDERRAADIMHTLADLSGEWGVLLPRSELFALARQHSMKSAANEEKEPAWGEQTDEIKTKAKTLADLTGVLRELQALRERMQRAKMREANGINWTLSEVDATITALRPIEKTYQDFQAGLPTLLDGGLSQTDQSALNTAALRRELILLQLPRYLGLTAEIKPQPKESPDAFVDRITIMAWDRTDLGLLSKACEAKRALSRGHAPIDIGMRAFVAAQNQEAAGQFMLAVASYQGALVSGRNNIPPKIIGQKLDALKATHPEDYEKGMAVFLEATKGGKPYPPPEPERSPNKDVPGGPLLSPHPAAAPTQSPSPTIIHSPASGH